MRAHAIADIDLAALRHNFARIKQLAPNSKVLAMVKGNAYGHGMIQVSQALSDADYLGVARLEEALQLREAQITRPIVLMSGVYDEAALQQACQHDCQLVVHSLEQIALLEKSRHRPAFVWLKIDTGMHRYGVAVDKAHQAHQRLLAILPKGQLGWLTHFACSDIPHHPMVLDQMARFQEITHGMSEPKSLANSAAILQYPAAHAEVVRPGLMLYGVSPRRNGTAAEDGLLPVMTLRSEVVALHQVPVGASVGYSATWRALRPSRLAVIPVGYADGYPQSIPNGTPVLVNGQHAKVAGRVSMDTLTVDVTDIANVQIGDSVILWGKGLTIETVAEYSKASVYGLLTGVTKRVEYRFLD
jgi:alanine racemase